MPTAPFAPVLRHIRALAGAAYDSLTDQQLLDRFTRGNDGAAFAVIVRRHGPMILGVCRRIVRDRHDADDAFQATFLVLVRRARKLRQPDLLGNWLFGVARRVARKAKARADRRRGRERPVEENSAIAPESPDEVRWLLDDAIARLPERYRRPLVLCCLEGLTQSQTAERLRCPPATVATRVARAKAQLRTRLTRMGLAPAAAALAADLTADTLSAAVPTTLVRSTSAAGIAVATGTVAALPASILTLTEGAATMVVHSWKTALIVGAALGLAGAGAGVWSMRAAAGEAPQKSDGIPMGTAPWPEGPQQRTSTAATNEVPDKPTRPGSFQTQNFYVTSPSADLARSVANAAEEARKDLAIEWLGREMSPWPQRCPVQVKLASGKPGGATTLMFDFRGGYTVLSMNLEGKTEQILRSTVRHEVMHTVLADHFRFPIPRWADEGVALLAEDEVEQRRFDVDVRGILSSRPRIPVRRLFETKDFPDSDTLIVLYAEGRSVTRFLIGQKDRPTFLKFVQIGVVRDWDTAAKECYGYTSVESLEKAWLDAFARGATDTPPRPAPVAPIAGVLEAAGGSSLPSYPMSRMPQAATAWVDEKGRLAIRQFSRAWSPPPPKSQEGPRAVTVAGVRHYSMPQTRAFRVLNGVLQEMERRDLSDVLKGQITVIVVPSDSIVTVTTAVGEPSQLDKMYFGVIKDGTPVLFLPPPDVAPATQTPTDGASVRPAPPAPGLIAPSQPPNAVPPTRQ